MKEEESEKDKEEEVALNKTKEELLEERKLRIL